MTHGRLITIEGLDGSGKTTLACGLADALRGRGVAVALLREPGGVPAAERLRELVKDPAMTLSARAEALLYAAARAQLVDERVRPELAGGTWVLLDRFVDSSLAYQGAGRGLGVAPVRALNAFATAGLAADRTILLRIDSQTGRTRLLDRGGEPDRLEQEDAAFFDTIAEAYDEIAAGEPDRIRVVDGRLEPPDVLAAAMTELEDLL